MDFESRLLRELQLDGRASVSALARTLGRPRTTTATALRRLLEDGAWRVVAAVDPAVLGQRVFAHLSIRVRGQAVRVSTHLASFQESVFVSLVSGGNDIVVEMRVGTMGELETVVGRVRAIPEVIAVSTLVYTGVLKGYFIPLRNGSEKLPELDAIDMEIIDLLQIDGRKSYESIGRIVSLSPGAVGTRIRRLRESETIKLGVVESRAATRSRSMMGVGVQCAGATGDLLALLRNEARVDFATRCLGRFDVLATVVTSTLANQLEVLDHIRSTPGVTNTVSWVHLSIVKEDYARTLRPLGGRW